MSNLIDSLRQQARQRMWRWLAKRQPPAQSVKLTQKFLFVFPTKFGFSTLLLVVLFYILGTNYQNNLIMLLAYFLLSLFLLSIGLSYLNLSGLTLTAGNEQAGFVGENVRIPVQLSGIENRVAIMAGFAGQSSVLLTETRSTLDLQLTQRGFFTTPRIKLASEYPFGLIRAWTYVSLAQQYWAYPAPIRGKATTSNDNGDLTGDLAWHHLSSYTAGDPIKNIDWKKLARQPLQPVVKHYRPEAVDIDYWLELHEGPLEVQLSRLCAEVLACEARQQNYGLRLPTIHVSPGHGPMHQQQVLRALALC